MKKTRMLATVASAAIVVVGIVPARSGNLATNFAMFFTDSPIDVSDGSIHAKVGLLNFKTWNRIVAGETYSAPTVNSDTIRLQHFTNSSFPTDDNTFQNTGAWFISITTGDPKDNRTSNPQAISLCSTDGFSSTCNSGSPTIDDGHTLVLIETHLDNPHGHNGQWEELPIVNKELTFHDTRPGCKQQNDKCEHVLSLTITTANNAPGLPGPGGATFTTSDPKNFHIIVGQ